MRYSLFEYLIQGNMETKLKNLNEKRIQSIVLIIFGIIINCVRLFQKTVWADECFTINLVKNSIGGIIEGTINDFHPPLYYLLCKLLCSILGDSIWVFRLASLLPILLLTLCGYIWLKKHIDERAGEVFAILVLIMPTSYYSIEIRMYSLALFFITIFVFTFIDAFTSNSSKQFFLAAIFAILGAYTHYFALLVEAILYCYFLLLAIIKGKEKIRQILVSIFVCIVAYMPWFIVVFKQMSGENAYSMGFNSLLYYAKPIAGFVCIIFGTLRSITQLSAIEIGLTLILALIFSLVTAIYIKNNKSSKSKDFLLFSFVLKMFIFTFICVYIMGCIMDMMSHKFVARYLYPLIGILFILFSIVISKLISDNSKKLWKLLIIIGIAIMIIDFGKTIYSETRSDREQIKTIDFITNNISEEDLIITDSRLFNWIVFDYYLDGYEYKLCLDESILNAVAQKHSGSVYFIHNENDGSISSPGDSWGQLLLSELGEDRIAIYEYTCE